jgi:hypothetical protein
MRKYSGTGSRKQIVMPARSRLYSQEEAGRTNSWKHIQEAASSSSRKQVVQLAGNRLYSQQEADSTSSRKQVAKPAGKSFTASMM